MKKEFIQFCFDVLARFCMFFFIININGFNKFYDNEIFFLDDMIDSSSRGYRSHIIPYISVSGPLKIQRLGVDTQFAPGIIYMYGQIYIGCSDDDIATLQGKYIQKDLTYNVCLSVDSDRNIATTNQEGIDYILGSANNTSILVGNKSGEIILNTKNSLSGNILLNSISAINFNANSIFVLGGIPKPGAGYTSILTIDSNGKLGIVLSSGNFKENIENLDCSDEDFEALKVVSYSYIGSRKKNIGFIAEDIAKSNTKIKDYLVIYDQFGCVLSIDYNGVIALNTYQILSNKNKIQLLENEVIKLKNIIDIQENEIAKMKNDMNLENEIIKLEKKVYIQEREIAELRDSISLLIYLNSINN